MECAACGGKLHRIHRTFWQRIVYYALYRCRACGGTQPVPRPFTFFFGNESRCPRCGTVRLQRLPSRDRIDPMYHHPLNAIARVLGGRLYHCAFCRIQFHDFRYSPYAHAAKKQKAEAAGAKPAGETVAAPVAADKPVEK